MEISKHDLDQSLQNLLNDLEQDYLKRTNLIFKIKTIPILKETQKEVLPTKYFENDAGWDVFLYEDVDLMPGESGLYSLGIHLEIPEGYFGMLKDRSGIATKRGIHILAGVIDSSFRGVCRVCLFNTSQREQIFDKGDKIAQLLILPVPNLTIKEVDELSPTIRGNPDLDLPVCNKRLSLY